jgi:hypothetical protein
MATVLRGRNATLENDADQSWAESGSTKHRGNIFGHVCKLGLEDNGLKRKDSLCRSGRSSDWFTTTREEETAMRGKQRVVIYGPKAAFLFAALLILSGCNREDAMARLKADLQADEFAIIHARFPCRSPDMHFFGYRFRIRVEKEYADGDVCWDASIGEWTWRILPRYPLSRLNVRK